MKCGGYELCIEPTNGVGALLASWMSQSELCTEALRQF